MYNAWLELAKTVTTRKNKPVRHRGAAMYVMDQIQNVLNFISLNLSFGKPAIVVVLASDQASISRHLQTGVGENNHNSQFALDDILSF